MTIWSAVGLPSLFVHRARCSPHSKSFKRESKSGGEPTALHSKTKEFKAEVRTEILAAFNPQQEL
jgi:hypothetical protein